MNGKVTQEEINKVVWQACDTFRGVIDPSQYKDYILTMLFLKYVSDVSKAKYKEYLQRYDGDTERAQRAMRRERFQVPEKSSFDYLFEHRNEPNIGELIDVGLADLEYENREKLSSEDGSGIFRNISFNNWCVSGFFFAVRHVSNYCIAFAFRLDVNLEARQTSSQTSVLSTLTNSQ